MSQTTNKPTHRLVRFYGEGRNAPRAELGVIFPSDDGRMTVIINEPQGQIRLTAFPIENTTGGAQ